VLTTIFATSLLALCAGSLFGCAVPSTGVVPLADGLAKVTHQGNSFLVPTATLKTQAVSEANSSCAPKKARIIDVKETQAKPMGGWPEAEVLFKCE
jgi:hypothetical protein